VAQTRAAPTSSPTDPSERLVRTLIVMRALPLAASFALLLLVGGSAAASGNPWDLRCASMPAERPAPAPLRAVALRFFPWVRPAAKALQAGPVYLVALSSKTAISRDGDSTDSSDYYLHRALIAVAPSYRARVTFRGNRLGKSKLRASLGFSTSGATACTVNPPDVSCGSRPLHFARSLIISPRTGWRIVQTELRIGRTGCFAISASGNGLRAVISLPVPGPDYGTTGW
jgi:hypothetical protein